METEKLSVSLDNALQFCAFSSAPIYVSPVNAAHQKFLFSVEEILEDRFLAKCLQPDGDSFREIWSAQEVTVRVGYRRQALCFTAKPLPPPNHASLIEDCEHIWFLKQGKADLANSRKSRRFSFSGNQPGLKLKMQISSSFGKLNMESRNIVDMSRNSLAAFFDRESGLVLPGDTVEEIKIYKENEPVLECSGSILRVDRKRRNNAAGKTYFVVINIAQPVHEHVIHTTESPDARHIDRVCLLGETNARIDAEFPLLKDHQINGSIIDISPKGMCFFVERASAPIVKGTILNPVYIQLPHQPRLLASLKVLYSRPTSQTEPCDLRVGGEFIGLSVELLQAINKTKHTVAHSPVVDAESIDYDLLLEFFFESGFIYADKRKQVQKFASQMTETYSRLLKSDNRLMKTLVYKDNEAIKGHISAVKYFDSSWVVQHMAGLNSSNASVSKTMLMEIIHFFISLKARNDQNAGYITCFFQPKKDYPNLVFGSVKSITNNTEICNSITLDYCTLKPKLERDRFPLSEEIQTRYSRDMDIEQIEEILLDHNQCSLIKIENLSIEKMENLEVTELYNQNGLYRYRKIYVSEFPGTNDKAFAIANFSSPGVNFSEVTNSFRILFSNSGSRHNQLLANHVADKVITDYEATDMPFPIFLSDKGAIIPEQFKAVREYEYWFYDVNHAHLLESAFLEFLNHIRDRIRKLRENVQAKHAA